jgi:hypothetical protein
VEIASEGSLVARQKEETPMSRCASCVFRFVPLLGALYAVGGCAAFRNVGSWPIAEREFSDGSKVILSELATTSPLEKDARFLELRWVSATGGQSYKTDISDLPADERLDLMVDSTNCRAWVRAEPSRRVVLSADFTARESWGLEDKHPDWTK